MPKNEDCCIGYPQFAILWEPEGHVHIRPMGFPAGFTADRNALRTMYSVKHMTIREANAFTLGLAILDHLEDPNVNGGANGRLTVDRMSKYIDRDTTNLKKD